MGRVYRRAPPLLFTLKEQSYLALGVYISDSHFSLGLVNLKGEVIKKEEAEVGKNIQSWEAFIKKLIEMIKNLISSFKKEKILGIGMAIPGLIDEKGRGIFYAPYS